MKVLKYLLLVVAWVIHQLPFAVHSLFAWMIAIVWFDLLRIRRKDAIKNVKRVFPEKTNKEASQMARKSIYHMGLTVMEFFSMPFLWEKEFRDIFDVEGEEIIKEAAQSGKGALLMSLHLGNGDLGTAAMASWGYQVHIISKIFEWKWFNDLWFSVRKAKGVRFIAPRKSSYEILKALKKNEFVIFVLDQYTGPPNGILTEFFGIQTGTAVGLALFSQRSGVPVIPIYTYRQGGGRNKIVVKPPIEFEEHGSKEESLLYMTEKYNRAIEAAILERPEQWMWVHRRWKWGFLEQKPLN